MDQVAEQGTEGEVTVRVENVGGIEEATVSLEPGVTVLRGRNATNRTSLLSAIAAALGSDAATLKADADAGHVELAVGDRTFTRVFERTPDGVRTGGEPHLADPTVADHFAFLLADNPARRAVERVDGDGSGLRELLLEPLDTDEIEAEIERLRGERADVEAELERVEERAARLPELEERRAELESDLEDAREGLAAVEERIDAAESSVVGTGPTDGVDADGDGADGDDVDGGDADGDDEQGGDTDGDGEDGGDADDVGPANELEEQLAALREARADLEDARYELETERESAAELREERDDLRQRLDELDPAPEDRIAALDERVESLRDRRSSLETEINELQSVVRFNEDMLAERGELFAAEADEPAEQLVETERSVDCWTCGSTVPVEAVETTLEHLRDRRERTVEERAELATRVDELESERTEHERRRRRREELEERLESVREQLDRVQTRVEERRALASERETEVEALESEIEAREDGPGDRAGDRSALVEHHRRARDLAVRVDRLEAELADVTDRIAEVEADVQHRPELEDRREAIGDQIRDLRTRVDRVERELVESFNEHVAEVLDVLEYDNLERVWLERRAETVDEGGRTAERRRFEHHVVRATEDGRTFEDTVDTLSESEREVIGLVVALAGYLVHDVAESVPFVLLDSVEAIDADRIATFVAYLEAHVDHLVVALLPEDAQALDDDYQYVSEF